MADPNPKDLAAALLGTTPNLNMLDKVFLAGGRLAEKGGYSGTPLKLYNDVIQRGRRSTITESDFTNSELDTAKGLILEKVSKTGKPAGQFTYDDYGPDWKINGSAARNLLLSLGGFQYSIGDDGNIGISDKWDFNRSKATELEGGEAERNPELAPLTIGLMPTAYAAGIGRQVIPDGTGIPVSVNIGANRTAQPVGYRPPDDAFLTNRSDASRRRTVEMMAKELQK